MRSKPVIALVAAIAVVAVVVLAFLGAAVLGVEHDLDRSDQALAFGAASENPSPRERDLSTRVGEAVLGVSDDRAYRDAAELAKAAGLPDQTPGAILQLRAEAEAILIKVVRGDGASVLRARAANLLGALLFEDAKAAKTNPRRYLEQSLGAFQDAVTLDPTFDVAQANLEIVAALPPGTSFRKAGSSGNDASASGGEESGY